MAFSVNGDGQSPQYYTIKNVSVAMDAWEKVAMVDYEELASKSLLISHLVELAKKGTVNVLDVGCGTGMFWKVLSKEIKQQVPDSISHIAVSLVDISDYCLETAAQTLNNLGIAVKKKHLISLENVKLLLNAGQSFDVIWSLHSLSSVEPRKVHSYFETVPKLLKANGVFWSLQQVQNSFYSEVDMFHSRIQGHTQPQFSTAEKFQDLAASVMKDISFQELEYYHRVQKSDTDTLEKYLHKLVYDNEFGVKEATPLIEKYLTNSGWYNFPQRSLVFSWHKK